MDKKLNFSSFQKAIAQLESALAYSNSEMAKGDEALFRLFRAACIQAFEYTYELSHKMLRRFLAETEANPEIIANLTFIELIRSGYQKGLLKADIAGWKKFREDRGATSHGYDEEKAQFVYQAIPAFLDEAKFLLNQMEQKLDVK